MLLLLASWVVPTVSTTVIHDGKQTRVLVIVRVQDPASKLSPLMNSSSVPLQLSELWESELWLVELVDVELVDCDDDDPESDDVDDDEVEELDTDDDETDDDEDDEDDNEPDEGDPDDDEVDDVDDVESDDRDDDDPEELDWDCDETDDEDRLDDEDEDDDPSGNAQQCSNRQSSPKASTQTTELTATLLSFHSHAATTLPSGTYCHPPLGIFSTAWTVYLYRLE